MGKIALAVLLVVFSVSADDLPEGWDVLPEISQFEHKEETFSLISVAPRNVKAMLEREPEPSLLRTIWNLQFPRKDANHMLHLIKNFIFNWSVNRKMVEGEQKEMLRLHLMKILTGKYPFLAVTKYHDPFEIYQLFGMGYDEGAGLPVETRLLGRGLDKPLFRPPLRIDSIPICYVPPRGKPQCHPEISAFLSRIRRVHGDIAEIRSLTKDVESPYDFSELLYYKQMADGRFFWGKRRLSAEERAPALTGLLLEEAKALHAKYPDIPVELLFPEQQEFAMIDIFYAHTLTDSRAVLYGQKFGTSYAVPPFLDRDYPGKYAHVLEIRRETIVEETPALLIKAQGMRPSLADGVVADNNLELFICGRLIRREEVLQTPGIRLGMPLDGVRVLGGKEHMLPRDCYIGRRIQEAFPEEAECCFRH